MRPMLAAVLLLAGTALPAPAHFVWIVPTDAAGNAQVIFSDTLEPDDNVPITKIAATHLFLRGADKDRPLKLAEGKHAYKVTLPGSGPAVIGGSCDYGVLLKGDAGPFRLQYHAKALVGPRGSTAPLAEAWAR